MDIEEEAPAPDRSDTHTSTSTLPNLTSMKRAPSDSTVNDSLYSKSAWERSQSEANLDSIDGSGVRKGVSSHSNSANTRSKVSENARVYWDLPRAVEQGTTQQTNSTSSRVVLETIHQREELKHFSSSSESLTRYQQHSSQLATDQIYELPSDSSGRGSDGTLVSSTKSAPTGKPRTGGFSRSCIRSCERLTLSLEDDGDGEMAMLEDTETRRVSTSSGRRVHVVHRLYHSDNDEEPTNNADEGASNYFCDSDFDDLREQRPNYLLKLEKMQTQLMRQMNIYKALAVEMRVLETAENSATEGARNKDDSSVSFGVDDPKAAEMKAGETEEERDVATQIDDVGKLVESATIESLCDALDACHQLLVSAWETPQSGRDFATSMCSLLRSEGLLDLLTANLASDSIPSQLRLCSARLLSQALTFDNVAYLTGEHQEMSSKFRHHIRRHLELMVRKTWKTRENVDLNREMITCLEAMFKHSEKTCRKVISYGGLRSVIFACRSLDKATLRHAAIALANLSLYGGTENQAEMIRQRVADWLFPLAFSRDDIIHYYACLAIVVLSTNRELSQAVEESGTLKLVLPFVEQHTPRKFAACEPSHLQGRSKGWLQRLVPTLKSEREEVQALAAFHFAMEAIIKRQQGKTEIFQEIGAVEVLRHVASVPNAISSRLAAQALESMGEEVPYKLTPQVPLWSETDVQFWLEQVGLSDLLAAFKQCRVDGDLLLTLTDRTLERDLGVESGLLRRRILRELKKLRVAASYHSVDSTQLDRWLRHHVGREFAQYSYGLIAAGVDRQYLPHLTETQLQEDCQVENGVHRAKILLSIEACKRHRQPNSTSESSGVDFLPSSMPSSATRTTFPVPTLEVNPSHPVCTGHDVERPDVFISYRRSSGSQLASLLKVHLQLRGYRIFLDIEKLTAGRFDESLLNSVRLSRNFVIVCTPGALDRCIGDEDRKDWIHKEIVTALESEVNIIPLTDRFEWPAADKLPVDMRAVVKYNGIKWIHEYQEACIDRLEKFLLKRELSPFSTPYIQAGTGWRRISTPESAQSLTTPPSFTSRPLVESIRETSDNQAKESPFDDS